MKKILNGKISTKIKQGYAALLLVFMVLFAVIVWHLLEMEAQVEKLTRIQAPKSLQSVKLLNGVNSSLAKLRAFMILETDSFESERQNVWSSEISAAQAKLEELISIETDPVGAEAINQIRGLLIRLKENQDKIVAVIKGGESIPARKILQEKAMPNFQRAIDAISRVIEEEGRLESSKTRKELLLTMANVRGTLGLAIGSLGSYIISGTAEDRSSFESSWAANNEFSTKLAGQKALFTESQLKAHKIFQLEQTALSKSIVEITSKRSSDKWNIANYYLKTRTSSIAFALDEVIQKLVLKEEQLMEQGIEELDKAIYIVNSLQIALMLFGIALASVLSWVITRSIEKKLSTETETLKASSLELKEASIEQLNGVTEQTSATGELSATIAELTVMSKTIVERCGQVTEEANRAVERCADGRNAVGEAQTVVREVKQQVEKIVQLMLNLGEKSQEINMAVDIISELSQQTTILSYNAAIEAAAAGEAGQSFAVVADQVGKLADRAKEASRDVRALIEDVQKSTNTTIMATEEALKAADRGIHVQHHASEKMAGVADGIGQTLEAAREIEMASTQQSTAASQVKTGIDDILGAAKRAETRSTRLLETAKELSETAIQLERM